MELDGYYVSAVKEGIPTCKGALIVHDCAYGDLLVRRFDLAEWLYVSGARAILPLASLSEQQCLSAFAKCAPFKEICILVSQRLTPARLSSLFQPLVALQPSVLRLLSPVTLRPGRPPPSNTSLPTSPRSIASAVPPAAMAGAMKAAGLAASCRGISLPIDAPPFVPTRTSATISAPRQPPPPRLVATAAPTALPPALPGDADAAPRTAAFTSDVDVIDLAVAVGAAVVAAASTDTASGARGGGGTRTYPPEPRPRPSPHRPNRRLRCAVVVAATPPPLSVPAAAEAFVYNTVFDTQVISARRAARAVRAAAGGADDTLSPSPSRGAHHPTTAGGGGGGGGSGGGGGGGGGGGSELPDHTAQSSHRPIPRRIWAMGPYEDSAVGRLSEALNAWLAHAPPADASTGTRAGACDDAGGVGRGSAGTGAAAGGAAAGAGGGGASGPGGAVDACSGSPSSGDTGDDAALVVYVHRYVDVAAAMVASVEGGECWCAAVDRLAQGLTHAPRHVAGNGPGDGDGAHGVLGDQGDAVAVAEAVEAYARGMRGAAACVCHRRADAVLAASSRPHSRSPSPTVTATPAAGAQASNVRTIVCGSPLPPPTLASLPIPPVAVAPLADALVAARAAAAAVATRPSAPVPFAEHVRRAMATAAARGVYSSAVATAAAWEGGGGVATRALRLPGDPDDADDAGDGRGGGDGGGGDAGDRRGAAATDIDDIMAVAGVAAAAAETIAAAAAAYDVYDHAALAAVLTDEAAFEQDAVGRGGLFEGVCEVVRRGCHVSDGGRSAAAGGDGGVDAAVRAAAAACAAATALAMAAAAVPITAAAVADSAAVAGRGLGRVMSGAGADPRPAASTAAAGGAAVDGMGRERDGGRGGGDCTADRAAADDEALMCDRLIASHAAVGPRHAALQRCVASGVAATLRPFLTTATTTTTTNPPPTVPTVQVVAPADPAPPQSRAAAAAGSPPHPLETAARWICSVTGLSYTGLLNELAASGGCDGPPYRGGVGVGAGDGPSDGGRQPEGGGKVPPPPPPSHASVFTYAVESWCCSIVRCRYVAVARAAHAAFAGGEGAHDVRDGPREEAATEAAREGVAVAAAVFEHRGGSGRRAARGDRGGAVPWGWGAGCGGGGSSGSVSTITTTGVAPPPATAPSTRWAARARGPQRGHVSDAPVAARVCAVVAAIVDGRFARAHAAPGAAVRAAAVAAHVRDALLPRVSSEWSLRPSGPGGDRGVTGGGGGGGSGGSGEGAGAAGGGRITTGSPQPPPTPIAVPPPGAAPTPAPSSFAFGMFSRLREAVDAVAATAAAAADVLTLRSVDEVTTADEQRALGFCGRAPVVVVVGGCVNRDEAHDMAALARGECAAARAALGAVDGRSDGGPSRELVVCVGGVCDVL